jgi:hypothetical protein
LDIWLTYFHGSIKSNKKQQKTAIGNRHPVVENHQPARENLQSAVKGHQSACESQQSAV